MTPLLSSFGFKSPVTHHSLDILCPPCSKICGKKLQCKNHKYPAPCHRGAGDSVMTKKRDGRSTPSSTRHDDRVESSTHRRDDWVDSASDRNEERGFFPEIADLIQGLGLTILNGVMEV